MLPAAVLLVCFHSEFTKLSSNHLLSGLGYGIGNIKGALQSWRYEFLIIGAVCSAWGIALALLLPNSPATFWGFNRDEKLMMIARLRSNQTGIEGQKIKWEQVKEAYLDYKT